MFWTKKQAKQTKLGALGAKLKVSAGHIWPAGRILCIPELEVMVPTDLTYNFRFSWQKVGKMWPHQKWVSNSELKYFLFAIQHFVRFYSTKIWELVKLELEHLNYFNLWSPLGFLTPLYHVVAKRFIPLPKGSTKEKDYP